MHNEEDEVTNTSSSGVALAKSMMSGCWVLNCKTVKHLIFGWLHEMDLLPQGFDAPSAQILLTTSLLFTNLFLLTLSFFQSMGGCNPGITHICTCYSTYIFLSHNTLRLLPPPSPMLSTSLYPYSPP